MLLKIDSTGTFIEEVLDSEEQDENIPVNAVNPNAKSAKNK